MSKAKELIENNILTNITVESDGVVYKEIAMTAVNMAEQETNSIQKKLDMAISALENISDPISYLRKEAAICGERLDGRGAIEFANNGICISKMAEDVLKKINE